MHHLIIQHRAAEDLPLAGIFDGVLDGLFHGPQQGDRAPQAFLLKLDHLIGKAFALVADAVALRHPHVIEIDQGGVRGAHAHLVQGPFHLDAGTVHGHDDQGFVAVHGTVGGITQQANPIGLGPVGDEHLGTVDDVVIAIPARRRLQRGNVGTRAGLCHADAGNHVASNGGGEELPPQLVRSELGQGRGRHGGLYADGHGDRAMIGGADLLREGHDIGIIQAHAAEFRGLINAQETLPTHLLEQLVGREAARLLPRVHMGVDLGRHEPADGIAQLLVLIGK